MPVKPTLIMLAPFAAAGGACAQEALLFQFDRTVLTPSRPAVEVRVALAFPPEFHALAGINLSVFIDPSPQFEMGRILLDCSGVGGCPHQVTSRGIERLSGAQLSSCLGSTPDLSNPMPFLTFTVRSGAGVGGGLLTTETTRLALYPDGDPCSWELREPTEAQVSIRFTDCEADCDTDGELTFFDFLCFQEL